MIREIDFELLPGLSRFFCEFLSKKGFIRERFLYFDELLQTEKIIEQKLKSYKNRDEMMKLVKEISTNIELSKNQKANLELMSKDNTLVVVASINPFFLGGPLSVLYKTLTSIFIARKLSIRFPYFNFVPIIWIEDNEHNCLKSFQITLLTKNYDIVNIPINTEVITNWRSSISNFRIPENLINFLEIHIHSNEYIETSLETSTFLINLYKNETSLTKTFVEILNYLLKDYGLLFIISSECRAHNSFAKILIKEIETFGASSKIIEKANKLLESKGIGVKSKNSFLNIFYHTKDKRVRLELNLFKKTFNLDGIEITEKEIVEFFEKNTDKFSPNVLLRPICQDFILPTIVSIQSPSEIVFFAQLKELYKWYDVIMPGIVPRHSITVIPAEYSDLVNTKTLSYFLKDKSNFEEELYHRFRNLSLQSQVENIEKNIAFDFESLREIGARLDKSLNFVGEKHIKKSKKSIDAYINKIYSTERRKILHDNKDLIKLNTFLYPNGSLQERTFALATMLFLFGTNYFIKTLEPIFNVTSNKHYVVEL